MKNSDNIQPTLKPYVPQRVECVMRKSDGSIDPNSAVSIGFIRNVVRG